MGLYEKMVKTVKEWKEGEHVLSRGKPMDDWRYGEYRARDTIIIINDTIMYQLWDTIILSYNKAEGILTLDHGGFKTKTTKEKINTMLQILDIPLHVEGRYETRRTTAGDWIVVNTDGLCPFDHAIRIKV